jgi:glycosyltransferase involved in cell wall biosynthesis
MTPLVSVLMSVYNGEKYLREAIASLESQSGVDFECLVIDDGSTDGSSALLRDWAKRDSRVRLERKETNAGLTQRLTELLAHAKAAFVARQDSDDRSLPDRLQRQAEHLQRHEAVALVGSAYDIIDDQGAVLNTLRPPAQSSDLKEALQFRNVLAHGSWMARRELLQDVGGYRSTFRYAQDYDVLLRVIEKGEIECLPDALYQLRLDENSLSVKKRRLQDFYAALARRCASARRQGSSDAELLRRVQEPVITAQPSVRPQDAVLLLKALHQLKGGQVRAARETLKRVPWTVEPLRAALLRIMVRLPEVLRSRLLARRLKAGFFAA